MISLSKMLKCHRHVAYLSLLLPFCLGSMSSVINFLSCQAPHCHLIFLELTAHWARGFFLVGIIEINTELNRANTTWLVIQKFVCFKFRFNSYLCVSAVQIHGFYGNTFKNGYIVCCCSLSSPLLPSSLSLIFLSPISCLIIPFLLSGFFFFLLFNQILKFFFISSRENIKFLVF